MAETYVWELRNPDGGPMGLEFARGRSAPTERMIAHSLPERVNVSIRDERGNLVARARDLQDESESSPMALFTVHDGTLDRANIWPTDEHLETPVILPGGEVGILKSWWNADDRKEWRWTVEFSNNVRGR